MYTLQRRSAWPNAQDADARTPISGEDGAKIGLADELVEPGEALTVAKQWAARFDDVAAHGSWLDPDRVRKSDQ